MRDRPDTSLRNVHPSQFRKDPVMRRTPSTDTVRTLLAEGATARPGFDRAYRELATARAAYDAAVGNPDTVPQLALAAARLESARRAIRSLEQAA